MTTNVFDYLVADTKSQNQVKQPRTQAPEHDAAQCLSTDLSSSSSTKQSLLPTEGQDTSSTTDTNPTEAIPLLEPDDTLKHSSFTHNIGTGHNSLRGGSDEIELDSPPTSPRSRRRNKPSGVRRSVHGTMEYTRTPPRPRENLSHIDPNLRGWTRPHREKKQSEGCNCVMM